MRIPRETPFDRDIKRLEAAVKEGYAHGHEVRQLQDARLMAAAYKMGYINGCREEKP